MPLHVKYKNQFSLFKYMITYTDFHNSPPPKKTPYSCNMMNTIKEKRVNSEIQRERERDSDGFTLALAHSMMAASLIKESPPASCLRILSV